MEAPAKPDIAAEIAAALDWWRDAGVDDDFTDEPRDWLAKPAAPETAAGQEAAVPAIEPAPPPEPAALIGGPPEQWPQDLEGFRAWWLSELSLDQGQVARRVPPRGNRGAELMIMVGDPEESDAETLLSGPHGKLLAGMLGALGLGAEQAYFASALPRTTPLPNWGQLAAEGLGAVVRHHVALAAPKRLIVFGSGVSSLLGVDPAKTPHNLPTFNHEGQSLPLLAAIDLAALLARPRAKAGLWQRLLDWTGNNRT